jgi:hypothetical protein
MKRKTNFDQYLGEQLKDEGFAERFKKAGEAWDVALELAALRKESGLSQKELAERAGTTQKYPPSTPQAPLKYSASTAQVHVKSAPMMKPKVRPKKPKMRYSNTAEE